MAEKPRSSPADAPRPDSKGKSMGEVLDEIGFVQLDPPRRIIVREGGYPEEPLTRWRKPKEQD